MPISFQPSKILYNCLKKKQQSIFYKSWSAGTPWGIQQPSGWKVGMRLEGYFLPYKSLISLIFSLFLPTFHSNLKN